MRKNKSMYDDLNELADMTKSTAKQMKQKEREEIELQRQKALPQVEQNVATARANYLSAQKALLESTPENRAEARAAYNDAVVSYKNAQSARSEMSDPKSYYKSQKKQQVQQNNSTSQQNNSMSQQNNSMSQQNNGTAQQQSVSYGAALKEGAAQVSDVMKSGIGAMAAVAAQGMNDGSVDPANAAGHLDNQARLLDKQAGDEQKNAQRDFQVSNRDYRAEAEKNAAAGAATENAQKVANMGAASAGAAALERGVKSADYNTHMNRSDTRRDTGVKNQREMYAMQQAAEEQRKRADAVRNNWNEVNQYNKEAAALSEGAGGEEDGQADSTEGQTDDNGQPQDEAPETVTGGSQAQEGPKNVGMQNMINYQAGSPVRRTGDGTGNLKGWRVNGSSITPDPSLDSGDPSKCPDYTIEMENNLKSQAAAHPEYAKQDGETDAQFTDRVNNKLGRGGNMGDEGSEFNQNQGIDISDESMKNIIRCLSDIRF